MYITLFILLALWCILILAVLSGVDPFEDIIDRKNKKGKKNGK
jgi:hypothetical protein